MPSFSVVNINYVYLLLIPPIVVKQHTIMLSILSLLSFAVIAACSHVNIEFCLSIQSGSADTRVNVTFSIAKNSNSGYCHIEVYSVTYYNIGIASFRNDHSINVSSDLIEPSKGFYLYWTSAWTIPPDGAGGANHIDATLTVSNMSVSYGSYRSEFSCNEVIITGENLDLLSPKITINSDCEVMISMSTCSSIPLIVSGCNPTPSLTSTLPDPSLCPTISLTSTYPTPTSTVSASPSPLSNFYDYSSSHITHHSPLVTSTFSTSSMPPNPSSIISSSSHPTHAPSLTFYSFATTVSSFSLFSPTISPSPLLCPAQDQWPDTAAGQNATGTCLKGTFNGQFDHLCYIHYIYLFISY